MKKILILCLTFTFAAELEVDGNLKVTGSVDANGNPITNVGEPILTTDVATANYVNARTAGKGRIIVLKCPWAHSSGMNGNPSTSSLSTITCTPPECPEGWNSLAISSEVTGISNGYYINNSYHAPNMSVGNSVRYCMEQETE